MFIYVKNLEAWRIINLRFFYVTFKFSLNKVKKKKTIAVQTLLLLIGQVRKQSNSVFDIK